jgi:hypothetical protein
LSGTHFFWTGSGYSPILHRPGGGGGWGYGIPIASRHNGGGQSEDRCGHKPH